MKVSAVVLTKNEERNIQRCLKSLSFCDEIVVIDDNSIDKTISIIKKLNIKNQRSKDKEPHSRTSTLRGKQSRNIKLFSKRLNGDFASQRNYGLKKAKNEWVLFVDADEVVSKKLFKEIIQNIIKNPNIFGYYLKRKDYFLGKVLKYGETGRIKLLRLGKKGKGKWSRKVHEYWKIEGSVGELANPLIHNSHENLKDLLKTINIWSGLHADENRKEGKRSSFFNIIFYPILHFINNYFIKQGMRDGLHGLVFAIFMSMHSYLAWSKLWLMQKNFKNH